MLTLEPDYPLDTIGTVPIVYEEMLAYMKPKIWPSILNEDLFLSLENSNLVPLVLKAFLGKIGQQNKNCP